jgi:hypothetical protein
MTNTEYLQEFNNEITASNSLPYCQIQNPPNLSLAQIQQFEPPWGWFIPAEQAEIAQFQATDDFEPVRLTWGEDTANPRSTDGFIAQRLRFVILHRSNIEVQEKSNRGWSYIGLAYERGMTTRFGELANSDRENYRLRTRYLLLFLDSKSQPLHQIPFRLGMGRGVGASFAAEIKEHRTEIEKAFFKLTNRPQQTLSERAHALSIVEMQLGLHKSDGKAPFICPISRSTAALDSDVGKENIVERRERKVTLIGKALDRLLISKTSPVGKRILSLWEEHQNFATFGGDDAATDAVTDIPAPLFQVGDSPQETLRDRDEVVDELEAHSIPF